MKNKGHDNLKPIEKGEVRNPKGRPKGSRNKFSELFLQTFLDDFEENGAAAVKLVRTTDPSTYLRVAASIVPKEFTINEGEVSLDRVLEQLTDTELTEAINGLHALGSGIGERAEKKGTSKPTDSVH